MEENKSTKKESQTEKTDKETKVKIQTKKQRQKDRQRNKGNSIKMQLGVIRAQLDGRSLDKMKLRFSFFHKKSQNKTI